MRNGCEPWRRKVMKPVHLNSPVSSFSASLYGAALRWRFAWGYPESEALEILMCGHEEDDTGPSGPI
jgi:hypothetical protein